MVCGISATVCTLKSIHLPITYDQRRNNFTWSGILTAVLLKRPSLLGYNAMLTDTYM
jgi:hypothetical protein